MRWFPIVLLAACGPPPPPAQPMPPPWQPPADTQPAFDPTTAGTVVSTMTDFAFDGGRIEIEMRRDGNNVYEIAKNHYAVAVVIEWSFGDVVNLAPAAPTAGVVMLPPAPAANGDGAPVVLTTWQIVDHTQGYHRNVGLHERFGDPRAQPTEYAYRLPYPTGSSFSVLQGFHGAFSHHGSNEYATDFQCPVATHVLAARDGVVVAANAAATGSGTTPDWLEYKRTNFVLVLHDDGTLGEYMHLSPSGLDVQAGQRVKRGDRLALSGNTGFSSTPHLHFQVMTANGDGRSGHSFAIRFAVAPGRAEEPVAGRSYRAWE